MKRRNRWLLAVGLAASLILGACGGGRSESGQAGGGTDPAAGQESAAPQTDASGAIQTAKDTLVIAAKADPQNLSPFLASNNGNQITKSAMLEKLFYLNEENEITPQLAESWEWSEDNLVLTVHLRKGVTFHNGEELKASDVVFSYQLAQNEAIIAAQVDYIDFPNIKAVDDYTVEIPLQYPVAMAESSIAGSYLFILNEKDVTEKGDGWIYDTVGTGAYVFESYTAGSEMRFVRNENYWGEQPAIQNLVVRVIPETSQALIELENGNVDMIVAPSIIDVKNVANKTVGGAVVQDYGAIMNWTWNFNMRDDILKDRRIRQAIYYALDLDAVVDGGYYGMGTPARSYCASSIWGFNEEYASAPAYRQDQAKAKELLQEAGYPDGFTFNVYMGSSFPEQTTMMQIIKEQLAEVGINLEIVVYEGASMLDVLVEGVEDDSFLYGWTSTTGEIDNALFNRIHTSTAGSIGIWGWENQANAAKIDELLVNARSTFEEEDRLALYQEVQALIFEEVPAIPLSERSIFVIQGEKLQGLRVNGEFVWVDGCYFAE